MARTCRNCYSSVNDEHKFCTQCGKEVPIPEYKESENEKLENIVNDKNTNIKKENNENGTFEFNITGIILLILLFSTILTNIFSTTTKTSTEITQKESSKIETSQVIKSVLTPDDKAKLKESAENDFNSRNYESSTSKYEKLLKANYIPAEVNFYLGQNWYMRKKYDVAINCYKKSAMLNDKAAYMPTLLLNSAISFENIKDKENAKRFNTTLIELYPSTDEANIAKKNHLLKNNINKQDKLIIEEKTNLYKESGNDSYSKKLESTTSSEKYDVTKNTYTPPEHSLPYNGEIRNYSYSEKIAPLNIKTSYGVNYLVKLKGVYNKEPIMTVFIIGGNEITINVPLGSFEITYASGNKWYGYDYLFGNETSYSKADEIFNFRNIGYEISGYTITLYRVSNGNLNTQNINQSQF